MKKAMFGVMLLFLSLPGVFSQDTEKKPVAPPVKLQTQLTALKVKSPVERASKSKMISKLWVFNENNVSGAAAVTTLEDYKVDFYILVLKDKDQTAIGKVDVLDDNALADKKMMKDLIDSLTAMNGTKLTKITDAITGATVYSKKIYLKIKLIAGQMVKEMEAAQ
jgi:hypothetical protein